MPRLTLSAVGLACVAVAGLLLLAGGPDCPEAAMFPAFETEPTEDVRVRGHVYDNRGRPLAGARVRWYRIERDAQYWRVEGARFESRESAVSDAKGRFELELPREGRRVGPFVADYDGIVVHAEGFVSVLRPMPHWTFPLTRTEVFGAVQPGGGLCAVPPVTAVFAMTPAHIVRLKLVHPDGTPAAGVAIQTATGTYEAPCPLRQTVLDWDSLADDDDPPQRAPTTLATFRREQFVVVPTLPPIGSDAFWKWTPPRVTGPSGIVKLGGLPAAGTLRLRRLRPVEQPRGQWVDELLEGDDVAAGEGLRLEAVNDGEAAFVAADAGRNAADDWTVSYDLNQTGRTVAVATLTTSIGAEQPTTFRFERPAVLDMLRVEVHDDGRIWRRTANFGGIGDESRNVPRRSLEVPLPPGVLHFGPEALETNDSATLPLIAVSQGDLSLPPLQHSVAAGRTFAVRLLPWTRATGAMPSNWTANHWEAAEQAFDRRYPLSGPRPTEPEERLRWSAASAIEPVAGLVLVSFPQPLEDGATADDSRLIALPPRATQKSPHFATVRLPWTRDRTAKPLPATYAVPAPAVAGVRLAFEPLLGLAAEPPERTIDLSGSDADEPSVQPDWPLIEASSPPRLAE